MEKFVSWSREYRTRSHKLLVLILGGILFVFALPYLMLFAGIAVDAYLDLPKILARPHNSVLGAILIALGLPYAAWSVWLQYRIGKGTPVPYVATQKLVISGPYKHVRNPMALGTIISYAGIGLWFNSISFIAIMIPVVFGPLLVFIKLIEEKELEERFGDQYRDYKKKTPS